jgi:hypothetical protein
VQVIADALLSQDPTVQLSAMLALISLTSASKASMYPPPAPSSCPNPSHTVHLLPAPSVHSEPYSYLSCARDNLAKAFPALLRSSCKASKSAALQMASQMLSCQIETSFLQEFGVASGLVACIRVSDDTCPSSSKALQTSAFEKDMYGRGALFQPFGALFPCAI